MKTYDLQSMKKKTIGLDIIALVYAIAMIIYFALKRISGDEINSIAFLTNCIPITLFPSLFLLPHAIKKRKPFIFLVNLLLSIYLLSLFFPRTIFKNRLPAKTIGFPISVITHNTGRDLPTYEERDQLIRDNQADIIILQEITDEYIEKHWPLFLEQYPYQAHSILQKDGSYSFGMGVLSRYPIVESTSFKLDNAGLVNQQRVEIKMEEENLTIYNVHTTFPSLSLDNEKNWLGIPNISYNDETRHREIGRLVELVKSEKNPTIIAGDFNFNDQTDDYKMILDAGLDDAYKSVNYGFGFSWPANRTPSVNIKPAIPFVRLDYLFHTKDFITEKSRILGKTGSDHKPLLVQLSLAK